MVEGDGSLDGGELHGIGCFADLGLGVDQDPELVHRGLALLVRVVLLDQKLDGLEEPVEVEEERDEGADLEGPVQHHGAADAEQRPLSEDAEQLGTRPVHRVHVGGVVVGVAIVAHHVAVVDHIVALPVVGSHDAHAVQALGQVGQHVGDAVTHPVVAALGRPPEPKRGDYQRRDDQ